MLVLAGGIVALSTSTLEWAERLSRVDPITVCQRLEAAGNGLEKVGMPTIVLEIPEYTLVRRIVNLSFGVFLYCDILAVGQIPREIHVPGSRARFALLHLAAAPAQGHRQ